MKQILSIIVLLIIVAGGYFLYKAYAKPAEAPINSVTFSCDQGKTIGAVFYSDKVALTLSDGRSLTIPQVISGSGARYANADESFVFWNKGNTAFVDEGPSGSQQQETYSNCVTGNNDENQNTQTPPPSNGVTYTSTTTPVSFTLQYPTGYTVNANYKYTELGPKFSAIPGVKFIVSPDVATGTNLSKDSGVTVEWMKNAKICSASSFLQNSPAAATTTDNGVTYTIASSSDAGAGNFYQETVYALVGTSSSPCVAVRYFVHTTNISNYPAGTVQEYDKTALLSQFDAIRRSLTLASQ